MSVFYAVNADVFGAPDVGGWRVYHFPTLDTIDRRPRPDEVGEYHFSSSRLVFTERLMLPEHREFASHDHGDDFREKVSNTHLGHVLLGHVKWLQGKGWSSNVRHLLTIDTDDNPGWMWGDSGLLYFGISADDLKAGRFDRTAFEMQCC